MPLSSFTIWVWVYTIAALCVMIIYALYMYRVVHKPMDAMVHAFQKVEKGDLTVSIQGNYKDEFGYLYQRFNGMVTSLRMSIDQAYRLKILRQRAELKQLQSQINPHFLYNSFFIINTMARIGDENLIPFTKYLGEYFRYVTRDGSDYVSLYDEVEHARTYTSIQSMRFSKSLKVEFSPCPEAFATQKVPRLIVQPIVENAFEHAVEKKRSNAVVKVNFLMHGKALEITVEDNGVEVSDAKLQQMRDMLSLEKDDSETTGLINVYRRMQLLYENESCMQFSHSSLGGLCVSLLLFGTKEEQE